MRILVLIHEYPPVGGGGGRVAQDLCEALALRGHEIKILTAHYQDLPEIEERPNLTIHRLKSMRKEPFRAGLAAMAGFVGASLMHGIPLIQKWKPDVIHVHFAVPAGPAGWLLSRLSGVPYVLTAHLGDVPGGVPEKTGKWFKFIFPFTPPIWRGAAAVTAVSQFTRSLVLASYHVPVQVIPNGVDIEAICPGKIRLNQPPRIVFAGRFMPQKNPVGLVRILERIKSLDWRATLIGDGPLRPAVEQEVGGAGLDDRILLTGWVTPDEVIEWYRQSDIMLMPSLSEGLPVVGVQGGAMGLALVLSSAGGNIDLVESGKNGVLLDAHDEAGFANALTDLLANPQKLLAQREASRQMAARFDLRQVVSDYEAIFERVKKRRG
jgi:glycosyltransferase involved in cell wall biosynthesis